MPTLSVTEIPAHVATKPVEGTTCDVRKGPSEFQIAVF